jgi:hypothetical protein
MLSYGVKTTKDLKITRREGMNCRLFGPHIIFGLAIQIHRSLSRLCCFPARINLSSSQRFLQTLLSVNIRWRSEDTLLYPMPGPGWYPPNAFPRVSVYATPIAAVFPAKTNPCPYHHKRIQSYPTPSPLYAVKP